METRPFIIGVSGGSGSGKTSLSRALVNKLNREISIISLDNYYKDQSYLPMEERAKINYDSPDSLDLDRFCDDLKTLKKGEPVLIPNYDFSTHSRTEQLTRIEPSPIIIAEGIMVLLLPKECFDLKVYVQASEPTRLDRRIKRDMVERGRSRQSVIDQFNTTVKPMHDLYVEPCKDKANFIFINEGDKGLDNKQVEILANLVLNNLK